MDIIYAIIGIAIGGGLGYFVFFSRYKNTKMIDELRARLEETTQAKELLQGDNEELIAQNDILKKECEKLKKENIDFQKIVSELNIYVHRIKEGGEKARELAEILGVYDSGIEDRIHGISGETDTHEEEIELDTSHQKKFF